jgi:cell wall-associated NlpC family hydrolase
MRTHWGFFGALAVLLVVPALLVSLGSTPATASQGAGPPGNAGPPNSPTPTNFWLATATGGVYAFGDAPALGSPAGAPLARPIVGITPTQSDAGYWLVASDGGIFTYGDAPFYGSTGSVHLAQPIVGMTPTPDGHGYWLVAADGGIFTFGDAAFYGSMGSAPSPEPTERIVASHSGQGYWVVDQNGTANAFGDASGTPPTQALMFRAATPGDAAVLFAFAQLGKPYIWGGNGPVGYDCSGLALASWQHADNVTFARVSDDQYQTAGTPVSLTDLIAGDLVFWGSSQTQGSSVYHTAIYVGGGRIVEATGDVVQLNTLGQWGSSDLMPNGRRP